MAIELIAAIFAFIAVTALALSVFTRVRDVRAVERRLHVLNQPPVVEGLEGDSLLRRGTSTFPLLRRFLANTRWADHTLIELQQAGLRLKVSEYFLLRLVAAALPVPIVILLAKGSAIGLLIAVAAAVVGFMVPAWYVHHLKGRRRAAIDAQMVEALQLISNALRSGFAFTQAVEMAAKQLTPPIRDELDHFLRDNALGARTDTALLAMVERTGSYDIEMMVTTIMVQRTTGGNLSEILDNVAETIRERERLQREIQALTAQQRLTGLVLAIYPLFLLAAFTAIAPSIMKVLWQEEAGRIVLVIALALQIMGALTIRRILTLDV